MNRHDLNRLADFSVRVRESTLKRLKRVPGGKENAAVLDGVMSPADIAAHLIHVDTVLLALPATRFKGLDLGVAGQGITASRAEYEDLVAELATLGDRRADFIRGLSDADLEIPIRFEAIAGSGETALGAMLYRYLDHEAHHRGALPVYLRAWEAGW
ncbi:MAG: DinB family protein [Candidatus Hydrogenedentes bacterium]|nr:DinB family protein [Candidatus Hydrogenedentota bacterium]